MINKNQEDINKNIKAHNKIAKKYKKLHTEIYNEVEQARLLEKLVYAKSLITDNSNSTEKLKALDYGCGDGNLTKHLLDIGFHVTSADISTNFLDLIKYNFPQTETLLLNGEDLRNIADNSFDFVCTYSVLHHIPDYLKAVAEMTRVLKPGGVIFLDHENSPNFWNKNNELSDFYRQVTNTKQKIKKFFYLENYYHKFIQIFIDKKHSAEGDIYVFADQHLNWEKILEIINNNNFENIITEDYLLFKGAYKPNIYQNHQNNLNDTRLLIAIKK